jgi:hypothetical protein
MLRPGFVEEWSSLDSLASGFGKVLLSKVNAGPSTCFKLFTSYDPEAILWLGFTSKDAAVRERFELFLKTWPEAKQRIPHALMQEMRITPELPAYNDLVHAIFLQLIDGHLTTPEEMRSFLEPYSPPAPPPKEVIKRPRAKRGAEAKVKEPAFDDDEDSEDALDGDDDLDDLGGDDDEIDLGLGLPKVELDTDLGDDAESADDEREAAEPVPPPAVMKSETKKSAKAETGKKAQPPAPAPVSAAKPQPASPPKSESKAVANPAPAKAVAAPAKPQPPAEKAKAAPLPPAAKAKPAPVAKKVAPAPVPAKGGKASKPAPAKIPAKAPVKAPAKPPVKIPAKAPVKAPVKAVAKASKAAPAKAKPASAASSKGAKPAPKGKPSKPAPKKPVPKPGKKR